MKKKILIAAMALVSAFSCTATMAACDLFKETDINDYITTPDQPDTGNQGSGTTTPDTGNQGSGTTTPDTGNQGSGTTTPDTGDQEITSPHTHTYEAKKDGSHHWQECSVCQYKSDNDWHTYVDGVCECGAEKPAEELDYKLFANSMCVIGIGTVTSDKIVVPETYHGFPVTYIEDYAFKGNTKITSVSVPSAVETGTGAFENCINLRTFTMVDAPAAQVTRDSSINYRLIRDVAFSGCKNLVSVHLSENVSHIGSCAFNSCESLTQINLPAIIREIEVSTFENCTSLQSLQLPENLIYIRDRAFANSGLTSLTIPGSVTSLGVNILHGCLQLENVYLSDNSQWEIKSLYFQRDSGILNYPPELYDFPPDFLNEEYRNYILSCRITGTKDHLIDESTQRLIDAASNSAFIAKLLSRPEEMVRAKELGGYGDIAVQTRFTDINGNDIEFNGFFAFIMDDLGSNSVRIEIYENDDGYVGRFNGNFEISIGKIPS